MIGWKRRIIVADDTARFQATDKMPNLANCEEHDRHLEHLAKHKDEINRFRREKVAKAVAICEAKLGAKKPLTFAELKLVNTAMGYAIGTDCAPAFVAAAEPLLDIRPNIHNYLTLRDFYRVVKSVRARIYGARCEIEKRCGKGANGDGQAKG